MRARFGFFRNFLFDWPVASAFMLCVLSFSFGISLIALYWAQRGLAFYMKRTDEHQVTTSSRTSSIGASSGFQSYGSMDSLCETVIFDILRLRLINVRMDRELFSNRGEGSLGEYYKTWLLTRISFEYSYLSDGCGLGAKFWRTHIWKVVVDDIPGTGPIKSS